MGVILMALARSGGVDAAVTAGTIIAGAYFGDRCSPASSSAALVAAATGTVLERNLRRMHRTGDTDGKPSLLAVRQETAVLVDRAALHRRPDQDVFLQAHALSSMSSPTPWQKLP